MVKQLIYDSRMIVKKETIISACYDIQSSHKKHDGMIVVFQIFYCWHIFAPSSLLSISLMAKVVLIYGPAHSSCPNLSRLPPALYKNNALCDFITLKSQESIVCLLVYIHDPFLTFSPELRFPTMTWPI